jgi:hypothetical protein
VVRRPSSLGELHPRFRKCRRHPLILDGFCSVSPKRREARRRTEVKCLHVLSSFQRTGLPRLARTALRSALAKLPSSYISFRGTFQSYRALTFPSTLFSLRRRCSGSRCACDRRPHAHAPPFQVFRAPRSATWDCELKEVPFGSALAARFERRGHARSNQYTPRIRGCQLRQSPEFDLDRTHVTDWRVNL